MTNATPDQLNRIESLVQANAQAIQELGQKFDQLATEVESETTAIKETQEKWDQRFFDLSRNMTNLAFGLIATATITIVITSVFK